MKILSLKRSKKNTLESFLLALEQKRKESNILVICPEQTEYAWLGIKVATFSLFGEKTLCVPQYFSESIFTKQQLFEIVSKIQKLQFTQIILSGFPPYFSFFVEQLYSVTKIKVIYHGFFAELAGNQKQIKSYSAILSLAKEGKLTAIGFIKAGMAKTVSKIYHLKCYDLILPTHLQGEVREKPSGEIHIGCLVNNSFRKNLHNQINAALMLDNAIVHVFENNDLNFLPQERIVQHQLMDHENFIKLLGSMHINLHVTYSESWGQVLSESIALGVPCLSAYTSAYFNYDHKLKQTLVVEGFDDSYYINKQIKTLLENYNGISVACLNYSNKMNQLSVNKLEEFVNA